MKEKIWSLVLGLTLVMLFLAAWNGEAAMATGRSVKLLFAHSTGCSHCAYQRPIVRRFETRHPEVDVKWVVYHDLDRDQRKLIEGTRGRHPVMVFYSGDHVRQVVGETSLDALEGEYKAFREQLRKPGGSRIEIESGKGC